MKPILPGPDYPAPAKLNLFLHVTGRRPDGYHLLQTVFRFISRGDTLRFRLRNDGVIARARDLADVPVESDLCLRAARLLQQHTACTLGADIELEKKLPVGGGLGGGSSNAATVLLVLNKLWQTGLSREQLQKLGLQLGADVPVFIFGQNAIGEGVGEQLQAITLPPAWYVVLQPLVMVSTPLVFSAAELTRNTKTIKILDFSSGAQNFSSEGGFHNDLQPVVCAKYPEVAAHLAWLDTQAKKFNSSARMTGSGACVFAEFAQRGDAEKVFAALPAGMQGFVAQGIAQHPLLNGF
ncbi:MAG: 4-(cytidine 5'-diphospho)-2-C-methyl-D-erythritol kinase [Burkholderiales bacterium]